MNTTTAALIPTKYTAAFLTFILVVVAGLQASLVGGITTSEGWQFGGLLVGAIVTYFAPLLDSKWSAALKVLGAVLGAVLVALVSVIDSATNGTPLFNAETIVFIVFAGVNALAAQFGVDQRIDATKQAIADPAVSTNEVVVVDPKAVKVVEVQKVDIGHGRVD